jgi:hypothetical protein
MNSLFEENVYCANEENNLCYVSKIIIDNLKKSTERIKNVNNILAKKLMEMNNELFLNVDMNEYWYLYFYNMILGLVLIYLFYKLSRFNNTLTNFNNNDIVVVHKKHVYKIIKRLKEEISSLQEENNTLKNERDKKKQIKYVPSNQIYDEIERIKNILSSDDRAAKKICLLNSMLKNK